MFISDLDSYEKEISADTWISRWIVQTIKFAYDSNNMEHSMINAHEVRALASSWALFNGVPLEEVVKASFWSSENSFIRFYLRDTSGLTSRLTSLVGPIVRAQSVVVPATSWVHSFSVYMSLLYIRYISPMVSYLYHRSR